jgi:hypothetical protein
VSGRFETSVQVLDFGREIEIGVTDTENPTRHMRIRVPELHIEEVAEMLHALADQLDLVIKGEDPKDIKAPSFDRLVAAFEEGVSEAQADPTT